MHEVALHGQDQSTVQEVEVDDVSDCVQQEEPTEGTSLAVQ